MIAIIDYGLGNVRAFENVYARLNMATVVARSAEDLRGAERVILPGVGAFDYAMSLLDGSGMKQALTELVVDKGVPVLGVCVGMQMLAIDSEEGKLPGLGWVDGHVKKIDVSQQDGPIRVPHMGWNAIALARPTALTSGIGDDATFYFLHSYYFSCNSADDVLAETAYGDSFPCAVGTGNVYGVQFHPEKSHRWGVKLLENFARL